MEEIPTLVRASFWFESDAITLETAISLFLGSIGFTLFALFVRRVFAKQDIASFVDLILGAAAYEVSIIWNDSLLDTLINGDQLRLFVKSNGELMVVFSALLFCVCLSYGELIWTDRQSAWAESPEKGRRYTAQGFAIGWVIPYAWVSAHIAAIYY
jgi:hypothetical protein